MNEEEIERFMTLATTPHLALTNLKVVSVPITCYECKWRIRMPMKKWYKSKTLWVNIVIGLAGAISSVLGDGTLSSNEVSALTAIGAIINIVLRAITKEKLTK